MNWKFQTFVFALCIVVIFGSGKSLATICQDPEVSMSIEPSEVEGGKYYVCAGESITFDASASEDLDRLGKGACTGANDKWISKFEWDWNNDDTPDYTESPGDGSTTHPYAAGEHTLKLTVTDNDNDCCCGTGPGCLDKSASMTYDIVAVGVTNLRFEKEGDPKDWITPCTLAEAYSYAIADIEPSTLSLVYEIVGDGHGASIDSSTGKITHDGSADGGTIQIKAYAEINPDIVVGPEDFEVRARPVIITDTDTCDPFSMFADWYGLMKKHTFESSTGTASDLEDVDMSESIVCVTWDFGTTPSNISPGLPNVWTLDSTGKMETWDYNMVRRIAVNINDYWPNSFPAIGQVTQRWFWYSEDGEDWVAIPTADEPDITITCSLIKLPKTGGVTAFKMLVENTSINSSAECSNEAVDYIKSGTTTDPPQYYVEDVLEWSNVQSSDLSISPSASTITPGEQLSATMEGIAGVTESEVSSASKLLTLLLIDDDTVVDDTLWTISNENIFSSANGGVPSGATDTNGNIKGNMVVDFSVTKANALNQRQIGTVIGPDDTSGETTAQIAFEIAVSGSNPQSPSSEVTGLFYSIPCPDIIPGHPDCVPLNDDATVSMAGCVEATVTSGTMNITLRVIDDDGSSNEILVNNISHSFTVPDDWIIGGLVSFGSKDATITNTNGIIVGVHGSSGEGSDSDPAEIGFEVDVGSSTEQSQIDYVCADQP
jgi:hypothetical protein